MRKVRPSNDDLYKPAAASRVKEHCSSETLRVKPKTISQVLEEIIYKKI